MDLCPFPECGRPIKSRGHCQQHARMLAIGVPLRPLRTYIKRSTGVGCPAQGCGRPLRAKGLCNEHYQRRRRGMVNWSAPLLVFNRGWVNLRKENSGSANFRVPVALRDKLLALAVERGMDIQAVAVDLLERYFKAKEAEKRKAEWHSKRLDDIKPYVRQGLKGLQGVGG